MTAVDYDDTKSHKIFNRFFHFFDCSNQTSIISARSKIVSVCKKYFEADEA